MASAHGAELMHFWDQPRHGGNSFNRLPPQQAYFDALRGHGADWVRLAYDKWAPQQPGKPGQPGQRDFLLGDADCYDGLVAHDLALLKGALARAERAGLKTVVAPLSLPFSRWSQNNGGSFDDRLWQDRAHWVVAARFWRDLAAALKDQPGIAAYNLINEPAPEKQGGLAEYAYLADASRPHQWYAVQRGGARDLPAFYEMLISAIREVDPHTPIMVDAGWYGAAHGFDYWPAPLQDQRVLYSFHMYEPYQTTSGPNARRAQPYTYPGLTRFADASEHWDSQRVARHLQPPLAWARAHGLAMTRMVVGEFGCLRTLDDCARYLEDVLTVLDSAGVHWAFYAFREDAWDGMDYELGRARVPWAYWQAIEQGLPDPLPRRAGPEFEPIKRRLSAPRPGS